MRKKVEIELSATEYKTLAGCAKKMRTSASQAMKAMALFFAAGCTHTSFLLKGVPTPNAMK